MTIRYTSGFKKHFKQRIAANPNLVRRFKERVNLFINSPKHPILKDHQLKGKKQSLRAFSVTGDIRVVYSIEEDSIYFLDIGTHPQVY